MRRHSATGQRGWRGDAVTAVCELRNIERRFGRQWALRNVSFSVHAGEALLLCGPNGAGKSTALSIAATLMRPNSGEVLLFGMQARKQRDAVRARLGYVPHQTLLDDALTAAENLEFYAALYAIADTNAAVNRRLEQAGLRERRDDRVAGFSRGMRQRLSLARALLHEPELLILDEPLTGLDASAQRQLGATLLSAKDDGCALLIVTHELRPLLSVGDRILLLQSGTIVEEAAVGSRDANGWTDRLRELTEGTT